MRRPRPGIRVRLRFGPFARSHWFHAVCRVPEGYIGRLVDEQGITTETFLPASRIAEITQNEERGKLPSLGAVLFGAFWNKKSDLGCDEQCCSDDCDCGDCLACSDPGVVETLPPKPPKHATERDPSYR